MPRNVMRGRQVSSAAVDGRNQFPRTCPRQPLRGVAAQVGLAFTSCGSGPTQPIHWQRSSNLLPLLVGSPSLARSVVFGISSFGF